MSGDRNPVHLDELVARRTSAGAPVVHGVNLLLWALDTYAGAHSNLPSLRVLRAQFRRLVYLNEPVNLVVAGTDAGGRRLSVLSEDGTKAEFALEFGPPTDDASSWTETPSEMLPIEPNPWSLSIEQISGLRGRVPFAMTAASALTSFPAATSWLGAGFVRGLAATSHLVGMICPGLHSIYGELSLATCVASVETHDTLAFRVRRADTRYSLVIEEIASRYFAGTVKAFLRTPPAPQPSMQSLSGIVGLNEFTGSTALIVGGSRGLGELTAKIVAAGGGRPLITWRTGQPDALRVIEDIRSCGGQCEMLHYDARDSAAAQLASLREIPTHAYYFATPPITRPRSDLYSAKRLQDFLAVYVDGFWQLVQELRARRREISLFYPSSVFVAERPPGMTEYAMIKAAGESLCADINVQLAPTRVVVKRLPRLRTDQTASLTPVKTDDPLATMLPIVREVQACSS